jgi:hypothetical protein
MQGSFRQNFDIFILFRHQFWQPMSKKGGGGRKFDMVSTWLAKSSTCLLAPEHSLHVRCCLYTCNQRRQEARRAAAVRYAERKQGAGTARAGMILKFDMVLAKSDMFRHQIFGKENPCIFFVA